MAFSDGYDYSAMSPFIEEFRNPFSNRPFITEMEENYGFLWQLKNCVTGRTLGVSRYKGYVHLLYKEAKLSCISASQCVGEGHSRGAVPWPIHRDWYPSCNC
jgi:hypothetical protein